MACVANANAAVLFAFSWCVSRQAGDGSQFYTVSLLMGSDAQYLSFKIRTLCMRLAVFMAEKFHSVFSRLWYLPNRLHSIKPRTLNNIHQSTFLQGTEDVLFMTMWKFLTLNIELQSDRW